jgi:hypothetical protein
MQISNNNQFHLEREHTYVALHECGRGTRLVSMQFCTQQVAIIPHSYAKFWNSQFVKVNGQSSAGASLGQQQSRRNYHIGNTAFTVSKIAMNIGRLHNGIPTVYAWKLICTFFPWTATVNF